MINFFRKTREKLADDNQFFKYSRYAIGEIILIMLGILLALQLSQWNQKKKDRIEEKLIYQRLNKELNYNLEKLSSSMKTIEIKGKALEQVSLAFNGRPIENDSIFLSNVIESTKWGWTVHPLQKLIYEEINNTGRIIVIRNSELRDSIPIVYNLIEVLEGTMLVRTGNYSRLAYHILPRENGTYLKQGLSSQERKTLVEAILKSDLDQHLMYEQNRAKYLYRIWNTLKNEISQVNTKIEAELNV